MIEQNVVCDCCNGTGKITSFIPINDITLRSKLLKCLQCDGTGMIEVVQFTKKEAELILSHCGIRLEELERI